MIIGTDGGRDSNVRSACNVTFQQQCQGQVARQKSSRFRVAGRDEFGASSFIRTWVDAKKITWDTWDSAWRREGIRMFVSLEIMLNGNLESQAIFMSIANVVFQSGIVRVI